MLGFIPICMYGSFLIVQGFCWLWHIESQARMPKIYAWRLVYSSSDSPNNSFIQNEVMFPSVQQIWQEALSLSEPLLIFIKSTSPNFVELTTAWLHSDGPWDMALSPLRLFQPSLSFFFLAQTLLRKHRVP